jgi:hypothetical protein
VVCVLVLAAAPPVHAQACCAGVSLVGPVRLTPHEDALVSLGLSGSPQLGSLDGHARFVGTPARTGALDVVQTLSGVLRVLKEGQLGLSVPLQQGVRWAPGVTEAGVGLGDLSVSFRYDFLLAGESARLPGLAVLAGVTLPTGRAPEAGRNPLGSDATGAGLWQGGVGVGLEQAWGHLFVQGAGLVQQSLPRTALGVHETLGPGLSFSFAAGWAFDAGAALALSASALVGLPAWLEGVRVVGTERVLTSLSLGGAVPLAAAWRLQGSVTGQLPLGLNEPVSLTVSVLLLRSWS